MNDPQALRQTRILYALLVLVTLAAFFRVTQNGFIVYDDPDCVTTNHIVQRGLTWDGFVWAFTSTYYSNWYPLTWLSHMLDVQWFGLNPGAHHFMNVLIHAASTLLLFHLLRRMTGAVWRSAFAAALFGWHPLRVESVAWVAERKDVLCTLFWMLTMLAYLRYTERPNLGRYLVTVLTFAFGLMTKPMLVTLPFVLLLLDLWPLKRLPWPETDSGGWLAALSSPRGRETLRVFRRLCAEKLPLFALTLVSCIVTFHVQQKGYAVASMEILPIPARLANVLVAYLEYLGKLVWPLNLAVIYPLKASQPIWKLALAVVVLGGISAWAIRGIRSRPYVLVGWLWYLGTLVPVIGLVQIGEQFIADRYTYIPMVGLGIIVAWGAGSMMTHRPALSLPVQGAGAAALVACILITGIQITYWKDSKTLFARALVVTRENPVALNIYGAQLLADGKAAEARELFLQSVALYPNGANARHCLGTAYTQEGKQDEAIAAFREALRLNPAFQEAHNAVGVALLSKQQLNEALFHFNEAARLDPNFLEPLFNRAITYQNLGNLEQARAGYGQVLKLKPDHRQTLLNLGNLLLAQRKFAEAVPVFQQLLRVEPKSVDALSRLAWILATNEDARLRNGAEAVRLAARACELTNNQNPQSLSSLAAAYAETGRFDEAVQTAQKALAVAQAAGQTGVVSVIQTLLQLYQARTPCRDVAQ